MRAAARQEEACRITGTVERVHRSTPGWSAGKLRTDKNGIDSIVSFAGACTVREGDQVCLTGQWTNDSKWGRQFSVQSFEYAVPVDPDGIAAYVAQNPAIKGIGPAKAKKLAVAYGARWDEALDQDVPAMAKTAGVSVEVITTLRSEWRRTAAYNQAATWLAGFGLTHHQIQTMVEKYGNNVVPMLQEDPYRLIRDIRGYGFKKVDLIARNIGTSKDHPSRLRAGLLHILAEEADDGHTWMDYEALLREANDLLILDTLDALDRIGAALESAVADGMIVTEQVGVRLLASAPTLHNQERTILEFLKQAVAFGEPSTPLKCFPTRLASLTPGQVEAVRLATNSRVMVLTGGAGTGKTYTVNIICDLYEDEEKTILLAAPTGKAAKRMEESTGRQASTIHRLLRYNGRVFEFDGELDADLLVLDEVSMMDVPLFAELLEHINPERTSLLLVGDHNQLPPVGPGNILRDLIQHRLVPVAMLDQVVRQAGALKQHSTDILRGYVAPSVAQAVDGELRPWQVVADLKEPDDLVEFLTSLYGEVLCEKYNLDLVRDVQVLTPQRKGPLGVYALNVLLQRIVQYKVFGINAEPPRVLPNGKMGRPRLYPGDKIIQRRNNYDLGIMNGAVGIVKEIKPGGDVEAVFDGESITLETSSGHLQEVDLAYALTIHQTQGSEFPIVLVICHKSHHYMHHRNLLYTGVTRSKQACAILGDHWGIRECAQKVEVAKRRTWLDAWSSERELVERVNLQAGTTVTSNLEEDDIPL